MKHFPIGGPREPVYAFMRAHGFVMSKWSDKVWSRADGLEARIYGTGSMLRISKGDKMLVEAPIREAMEKI